MRTGLTKLALVLALSSLVGCTTKVIKETDDDEDSSEEAGDKKSSKDSTEASGDGTASKSSTKAPTQGETGGTGTTTGTGAGLTCGFDLNKPVQCKSVTPAETNATKGCPTFTADKLSGDRMVDNTCSPQVDDAACTLKFACSTQGVAYSGDFEVNKQTKELSGLAIFNFPTQGGGTAKCGYTIVYTQ